MILKQELLMSEPERSLVHSLIHIYGMPVTDRLAARQNLEECFFFYRFDYFHAVPEEISSPVQSFCLGGNKYLVSQFPSIFEEFE